MCAWVMVNAVPSNENTLSSPIPLLRKNKPSRPEKSPTVSVVEMKSTVRAWMLLLHFHAGATRQETPAAYQKGSPPPSMTTTLFRHHTWHASTVVVGRRSKLPSCRTPPDIPLLESELSTARTSLRSPSSVCIADALLVEHATSVARHYSRPCFRHCAGNLRRPAMGLLPGWLFDRIHSSCDFLSGSLAMKISK